ncbi:hypothetical protein HYR54_12940 [Candidatus Acetothermia bacterium]|nr:hypothetical protein [Candidatus Acetothermia bacterium]
MRKEKAQACRTKPKQNKNSQSAQIAVPLQATDPDLTLVTIPFENTDGTSGALFDLQNEIDQSQQATWAGIEQGERYEHLQGDDDKSYLFPGATPTQQAITDAQQSDGFQEIQADMQAQGLSLLSDGIQVVVDEGSQEALLALPVTSASTAPASTLGKIGPAAITPSTYYYAWVNVDEVTTSGTAQVQVGSLRVISESLSWFRSEDLDDPAQLMSPYNWTPQFGAAGKATTLGSSRCNSRGKLRVSPINRVIRAGVSPYTVALGVQVSGGKGSKTVTWYYGDGRVKRFIDTCTKNQYDTHTFSNIAGINHGVEAVYQPQVFAVDQSNPPQKAYTRFQDTNLNCTLCRAIHVLPPAIGTWLPKDPTMPIVIVTGIGSQFTNPDIQALKYELISSGYKVYVVDSALYEMFADYGLPGVQVAPHIPTQAALHTQKQLLDLLGPDQQFIAIAHSSGGLVMRFLIEHTGADVVGRRIYNGQPQTWQGWDESKYPPWFGEGGSTPDHPNHNHDVAPCTDCGFQGFDLPRPWKDRVVKLFMYATPNWGSPFAESKSLQPDICDLMVILGQVSEKGWWESQCKDLSVQSPFLRALGYAKPPSVSLPAGTSSPPNNNVEYVSIGLDANDGLPYWINPLLNLFYPFLSLPQTAFHPSPWALYPSPTQEDNRNTDTGLDIVVPAQSPWIEGVKYFILWDGDDPYPGPDGYATWFGTNDHSRCELGNLWIWNRIIEDIEGQLQNGTFYGINNDLLYSGEGAISGRTSSQTPAAKFPFPAEANNANYCGSLH